MFPSREKIDRHLVPRIETVRIADKMAKTGKGGQRKMSKVEHWDDPEKTEVDACKFLRLKLVLNCY